MIKIQCTHRIQVDATFKNILLQTQRSRFNSFHSRPVDVIENNVQVPCSFKSYCSLTIIIQTKTLFKTFNI